ncbi:MAG: NUDIX domain-containing protein [Clostridia bacterium]|nr:NUDIX domain-containing protein [Clostridia bacterium]
MNVVGTMFFKNKKILIDKPRKRPTYQMIGGRVEENETTLEAAVRECHEELGKNVRIDKDKFKLIMDFNEIATSDQKTKIHFYVYRYNGKLEGEPETSEEIEKFLWYDTTMEADLSNTLKNEIIPYCKENKLIN